MCIRSMKPKHVIPFLCFSLTCVYSYVPNKLAGLFESLSTVMAAVCEPTAINVFLVVSGTRGERPVEGVKKKGQLVLHTMNSQMITADYQNDHTFCFVAFNSYRTKYCFPFSK